MPQHSVDVAVVGAGLAGLVTARDVAAAGLDVLVLEAAKEKKLISQINMGSSVYATVVPANGVLFIMNRNQLWALSENK